MSLCLLYSLNVGRVVGYLIMGRTLTQSCALWHLIAAFSDLCHLSIIPLDCGWYAVVLVCWLPINLTTASKIGASNWAPLSVVMTTGKRVTHMLKNVVAIVSAVMSAICVASGHLVVLSSDSSGIRRLLVTAPRCPYIHDENNRRVLEYVLGFERCVCVSSIAGIVNRFWPIYLHLFACLAIRIVVLSFSWLLSCLNVKDYVLYLLSSYGVWRAHKFWFGRKRHNIWFCLCCPNEAFLMRGLFPFLLVP